MSNFQADFSDWWLKYLVKSPLDECPWTSRTISRWLGAIRQTFVRASVDPDLCRHMASLGHNEKMVLHSPMPCADCEKCAQAFGALVGTLHYWCLAFISGVAMESLLTEKHFSEFGVFVNTLDHFTLVGWCFIIFLCDAYEFSVWFCVLLSILSFDFQFSMHISVVFKDSGCSKH